MHDAKGIPAAREAGLTASGRGALPRDAGLEPARARGAALAEHRERRVGLAGFLLAAALLLGLGWLAIAVSVSFPASGVPSVVAGQVVDATDDAPVPNASVEVVGSALSTTTDATGNFTIAGVPSGVVRLRVSHASYIETTYIVFVNPEPGDTAPLVNSERLRLQSGAGTATVDLTSPRTASIGACLVVLVVGNVLTALGLVATLSRRRYGHAVLGAVGAVLSIGFYLGALLGLVAFMLLRGAREEFEDRRTLLGDAEAPPLYAADEDSAEGRGAPPANEEEGTDAGGPGPPADEGAKEARL